MAKENFITNQSENKMRSSVEKAVNLAKKTQKENVARVRTVEGKAAAMANIFGTSSK